MKPRVAVFGGSGWQADSSYWKLGINAGRTLAEAGIEVVTGGYGGAMEAVSQGAVEAGGNTFAYLHSPPEKHPPNRFVQDFEVRKDYQDRLAALLRIPVAVALPGSSGTLAEVMVSLALIRRHPGRHLALWRTFWEPRIASIMQQMGDLSDISNSLRWFDDPGELADWITPIIEQGNA